MISMILCIVFFMIVCRLCAFAFRAAWGIGKIILSIVLPIMIIGLVIAGIVKLVIPLLVIAAVIYLFKSMITN